MGQTKIVRKKEKPTWYPTESTLRDKPEVGTVVPPGPDNPLGEYALYLGWPTYLIHGTNKPYGVGRRVSRGCIRMYPQGVERLFAEIPVGTPVTAVNQPVKLGWHMGELYLEAQPDFAQIDELEETQGISPRPADRRGSPADPGPRRAGRLSDRLGGGRGRAGRAAAASRSRSPAPTRLARGSDACAGAAGERCRRRASRAAVQGGTSGIY